MSCDARFRTFCATISGTCGPLANTFPNAPAALEMIQEIARNRAPTPPAVAAQDADAPARLAALKANAADTAAEQDTLALFRFMQTQYGLYPPTHGRVRPDGSYLPKRDACYGYQAVWKTIQAVQQEQLLPILAYEVLHSQERAQEAAARAQRRAAEAVRRPPPGVADDPGAAEFDDLIDSGRYFPYYGAESNFYQLGAVTFEAVQDELDGYRSYLTSVARHDDHGALLFRHPIAEVTPRFNESAEGSYYQLVDRHGRIWLEFGTVIIDEYYCDFLFHPYAYPPDLSTDRHDKHSSTTSNDKEHSNEL